MSNVQISIIRGMHRGQEVSGVFPLVKAYADNGTGGSVTVMVAAGTDWAKTTTPRIKLGAMDFVLLDATGTPLDPNAVIPAHSTAQQDYEAAFMAEETEEEAMERIGDTFLMLDKITDAASKGTVRGLVVSGPPGIGKSFGVEKQLEAANMFRTLKGKDPLYEVISGGVSSIGLYQKLYHNRGADHVVVFDDCDGVLFEEECLNLLKAALNSGDKRRICWNKESRVLQTEDIPESFDFEGSIIFLSNIDFDRSIAKGSRIAAHLGAIMSRCHYLDLEIGSMRDKLLRIKQIVRDGMLAPFDFTAQQEADVVAFVMDNSEYLREVSLRMVKKVADFVKADPIGWYEMAEATCLTKDAKFKRLYERKQRASESKGLVLA